MKDNSESIEDLYSEITAEYEYDKEEEYDDYHSEGENFPYSEGSSEIVKYCNRILLDIQSIKSLLRTMYVITIGGSTKRLTKKLTDNKIYTVHINSDAESIKDVDCMKKILLQKSDKENVRKAIYEIYEEIKDCATLVVVGSLAGSSSYVMLELIKFIKRLPLPYALVVVAILPFSVESLRRKEAIKNLESLRTIHDCVIVFDNDSLSKNGRILEEFSRVEDNIIELVMKIRNLTEDSFKDVLCKIIPTTREMEEIIDKVTSEFSARITI